MSENGRVVVIGAVNVDLVVEVPSLPGPGETVVGADLARHPGGKGGNQAVAAARAGAPVRFVGAVGADPDGDSLLTGLTDEGIEVEHVTRLDSPTGAALIAVAPDGQNQIAVAAGANARVEAHAPGAALAGATHLLISLEIPLAVAERAVTLGTERGLTVILNPAPARTLPDAILRADPILVVNEHELLAVGAAHEPSGAVAALRSAGISRIIETRGARGAVLHTREEALAIPARSTVRVVDATGAGDTFCGVLAAWLAAGATLEVAIHAANAAAGLSVEHRGARGGMPSHAEIVSALA